MATSSTPTNEAHDCSSRQNEDTDWVVVKAGADTDKEDFEMIDSAEAQCWCGGSDFDICRQKGHRWPLCQVDRTELLPKQPKKPSDQSHGRENKDKRENSNSDGDQLPGETWTCDLDRRQKKKGRINIPPASHNMSSGPFSQLAILTDLLDPAGNDDEDLYSAYQK